MTLISTNNTSPLAQILYPVFTKLKKIHQVPQHSPSCIASNSKSNMQPSPFCELFTAKTFTPLAISIKHQQKHTNLTLAVCCRICFAVGEILLLAGLSVESGHLKNWSKPRTGCYMVKEGLFSAAGVFALTTVFLAAGLYLTALRGQRMSEEIANVRREVLEASAFYASPPRSPQRHISTVARENPTTRESQNEHLLLSVFPTPFNKSYNIL